jgi:hypothetical protein
MREESFGLRAPNLVAQVRELDAGGTEPSLECPIVHAESACHSPKCWFLLAEGTLDEPADLVDEVVLRSFEFGGAE